jgi:hypothetical protein
VNLLAKTFYTVSIPLGRDERSSTVAEVLRWRNKKPFKITIPNVSKKEMIFLPGLNENEALEDARKWCKEHLNIRGTADHNNTSHSGITAKHSKMKALPMARITLTGTKMKL